MENNSANNSEKVLLCNHCNHINPLDAKLCQKCGFTVYSNPPIDKSEAFALQEKEIQRLVEEDKKKYEAANKKLKLTTKIILPILAVWAILTASTWIISTYTGPQDRTETVPINYKDYNDSLEIGADAKIEIKTAFPLASEYKELSNDKYVKLEEKLYYYVFTADGEEGVIKVELDEAQYHLSYPSYIKSFTQPVTYYGTIVDAPDETLLKYEKEHGKWSEDTLNLKDALKSNKILKVNFSAPKEKQVTILGEKTLSDKIFKSLILMTPIMIFTAIVLLIYKTKVRKMSV